VNLRKNREVRRKEDIVRIQKRHQVPPASSNPWSVCGGGGGGGGGGGAGEEEEGFNPHPH